MTEKVGAVKLIKLYLNVINVINVFKYIHLNVLKYMYKFIERTSLFSWKHISSVVSEFEPGKVKVASRRVLCHYKCLLVTVAVRMILLI